MLELVAKVENAEFCPETAAIEDLKVAILERTPTASLLMETYLATEVAAAAIAAVMMYIASNAPSYKAGKAGARLPPGPKQH